MSKIEWTDKTWNPVTGCDKVSQGCKNCYAEIMHRRLMHIAPHKYTKPFLGNIEVHYDELSKPIKIRKPTRFFVNSMSDLFHDDVPHAFIHSVFLIMEACYQHTFQILTKRPENLINFINWRAYMPVWPSNVWIGVSCEDQQTADQRIPLLLQVPAAVRFLSCEPLLGPIDLTSIDHPNIEYDYLNSLTGEVHVNTTGQKDFFPYHINWVIVGGESGHHARPMHPDWVRSLRDQCKTAHVPFFFKQWGEYIPFEACAQMPFYQKASGGIWYDGHQLDIFDPETGEGGKFQGHKWYGPMDSIFLCEQTNSSECDFLKVGKANSGNFLDDDRHLNFPV